MAGARLSSFSPADSARLAMELSPDAWRHPGAGLSLPQIVRQFAAESLLQPWPLKFPRSGGKHGWKKPRCAAFSTGTRSWRSTWSFPAGPPLQKTGRHQPDGFPAAEMPGAVPEIYRFGTRYSLTEAALLSGFGSCPQFHRVFCRYLRQSPAVYARSVRNAGPFETRSSPSGKRG